MVDTMILRLIQLLFLALLIVRQVNATNNFIQNLVLYDTSSNPGVDLGPVEPGLVINLATTGSELTILAKINSTVIGYVLFRFDDTFTNKENFPFYALNGNSGSYLNSFKPLATVGEHTLVAEFYNARNNALIDTIQSTFTVIDTSSDTNNGPLTGFSLVNTITGDEMPLPSVVDLEKYGKSLSIVASTRKRLVDDVVFMFDNKFIRVENSHPWAINGNEGVRIFPFGLLTIPGVHTVTAIAQGFNEEPLGNLTFTFTVFDSISTEAPFGSPIPLPSNKPSFRSGRPTIAPTRVTTSSPTKTVAPTTEPTEFDVPPSSRPESSALPISTSVPTESPQPQTELPTREHTGQPSLLFEPSDTPSYGKSYTPTMLTSVVPTEQYDTTKPTTLQTDKPTSNPTTSSTQSPLSSVVPTQPFETEEPTIPTSIEPSSAPTQFTRPSPVPSTLPTQPFETDEPTLYPTIETVQPTPVSSTPPTQPFETNVPTLHPTINLSNEPSSTTTPFPTRTIFTALPTSHPTFTPVTVVPISVPTKKPSLAPIAVPSPIMTSTVPTPMSENVIISGELRKWHKVTLSFTGPFSSETDPNINPFMDFRLDVTFTHELAKKQYVVPGYYAADGNAAETSASNGTQWHCHFSPDEIGYWKYDVSFVTGKDVSVNGGGQPSYFNGATGSFEIMKTDKVGRDHRGKGRLRYVGAHHLQFAEGEWFLKAGADSPENFLAYEDFDNTPNNGGRRKTWSPHIRDFNAGDPTWQENKGTGIIGAINYLSNEGMNVFSFLTMNIDGDDENVFPYISDLPEDRLRLDVSKLAQWEIVFEHADKMGMYLHFKTAETENDQLLDGGLLGNERKLYYRELIARFSHHLALNWNLSEEISNPVENINEFADFFKALDPYNHIVLFHTGSNSELYSEFLGYPSIDGASLQDNPSRVFSNTLRWVLQSAALGKKWIVSNDEQNSANDGVLPDRVDPTHDIIRINSLWGNIMAGGAGVEYYFGYGYEQSDITCEDFRSRANMWQQSRYALQFFRDNDVPFWAMSNDNVRLPDGSIDWVLSSNDGEILVVFRKGSNSLGISMVGLTGRYLIDWYNPREGGPLVQGTVTSIIAGSNTPISYGDAPGSNDKDWVVLIRRT